jgi:predicted short-subunit dehydrogenase-like oxidoreductase (DUF2520 family)
MTRMTQTTRKISAGKNRKRSGQPLPSVTLIGHGNWGTALAFALHEASISLREIIVRNKRRGNPHIVGVRVTTLANAALDADVLWICTPDATIASVADKLAAALSQIAARTRPARPVVFHSSGALASAELAALQRLGISVASVHPLMTFPQQSRSQRNQPSHQLAGVPFAIEGDSRACNMARKLVRVLGGEAFTLAAENKPLYHAFGAFASPLVIALLTAAMETAVAAGYTPTQARRRIRPIVERTVSNFFTHGPDKSFSGPIARGDAATIARHLDALRPYPRLLSTYRGLARFALDSLPAQNKKNIQQLLDAFPSVADE